MATRQRVGFRRSGARAWALLAAALVPFGAANVGPASSGNSASVDWAAASLPNEGAIVSFEDEARTAGALGFYWDDQTASLVVLIPASQASVFTASGPTNAPFRITLRMTDFDAAMLQTQRDMLTALMTDHPNESMAFGLDPTVAKLKVITTLDYAVVTSALGNHAGLIDYSYGSIELLKSRQADTQPFWGGAALAHSQSNLTLKCTAGMTVLRNGGAGKPVLVTAGHCYRAGHEIYTPAAQHVGQVVQRRCGDGSGNDMETIEYTTYNPDIFVNGVDSTTGGPVVGAGAVAVGTTQYRYSGATTGEHGLFKVTDDDWQVYIAPEERVCDPWTVHVSYVERYIYGEPYCDLEGGDSGAPFYYRDNFNNVSIRGMMFARRSDHTACFAENWPRIQNQLNVVIDT